MGDVLEDIELEAVDRLTDGIADASTEFIKLGGVAGAGSAGSGSISDNRLTQYPPCEPFFQIIGAVYPNTYYPTISFSGNNLLWSYPRSGAGAFTRPDITLVYGLY